MTDKPEKVSSPAGKGDKTKRKQISEKEWDKKYEETFRSEEDKKE